MDISLAMVLVGLPGLFLLCVWWLRAAWRGRLVFSTEGFCAQCDYDLRAIAAEVERCPECGQPATNAGRSTGIVRRRRKADVAAAAWWTLVAGVTLLAVLAAFVQELLK